MSVADWAASRSAAVAGRRVLRVMSSDPGRPWEETQACRAAGVPPVGTRGCFRALERDGLVVGVAGGWALTVAGAWRVAPGEGRVAAARETLSYAAGRAERVIRTYAVRSLAADLGRGLGRDDLTVLGFLAAHPEGSRWDADTVAVESGVDVVRAERALRRLRGLGFAALHRSGAWSPTPDGRSRSREIRALRERAVAGALADVAADRRRERRRAAGDAATGGAR